jgi:hypothetical protein
MELPQSCLCVFEEILFTSAQSLTEVNGSLD